MKYRLRRIVACMLAIIMCLSAFAEGLPGEGEHDHILKTTCTVSATCAEAGEQIVTCTVEGCEYTVTEVIPAGHQYVYESNDTQHWQVCSACGDEIKRSEHWISCVDGLCRHCGQPGTNEPDHNCDDSDCSSEETCLLSRGYGETILLKSCFV